MLANAAREARDLGRGDAQHQAGAAAPRCPPIDCTPPGGPLVRPVAPGEQGASPLESARLWQADAPDEAEPAENRLARLAGAVGPLRRVLAAIAERLLATEAYARLCYARVGDYARERAGVSVRQLQELARVHRAFAELPALERALVANELPWSKVRLVARVATAQDEGAWIARARALPTRRLEEEVRANAPPRSDLEVPDEALPSKRVAVRCTPAVAEKWCVAREMAERVAGQRLLAGEALEFIAAEVFSAISIAPAFLEVQEGSPAGPPADGLDSETASRAGEAAPAARAPGQDLPPSVAALASGLAEADAFELDRRLRRAVRLEQTLDAAIAPLLRIVNAPEYEWRGDYQALPTYVREQLGMSVGKARALMRLEGAGDMCRELRDAYRSGRLSWVKASCLLPLLLLDIEGEWRAAWVAWAERVTVRRLAADIERALLLRAGHDRAFRRCQFHPDRAQDPIPPAERQLCAPEVDTEATQELAFRVPVDVAALFYSVRETLCSKLRAERGRWLHEGEAFDAMLDCALLTWTLRDPRSRPPDPVVERDGYRCAVPGCTSRRSLHRHHIRFRSAGGLDLEANLITLCAFHHQRCLHAGILRVRGSAPGGLVFELGLRPGAPPLERYRSGDVAAEPGDASAPEVMIGPPIDEDDGTRFGPTRPKRPDRRAEAPRREKRPLEERNDPIDVVTSLREGGGAWSSPRSRVGGFEERVP